MADDPSAPKEPLDVKRVHYLVRLMRKYDLTSLDLSDSTVQIRLRRRGSDAPPSKAAPTIPPSDLAAPSAVPPSVSPAALPESAPTSVATAPKTIVIESPMVGTYFASSAPDVPPFVSVGSVVHADSIVCIIEAMKVFTDIPAGVSGTIAAILVKNGQPVEFGQPLFRLIPG
jgi:acetyl-CoA carboxylase biotin carboxyl carrier protein